MSSIKKEIKSILISKSYGDLLNIKAEKSKIVSRLISMTYDKTDTLSWRAIEAIGVISGYVSQSDPEFVRNLVGRLLWMIRDESGGIGWSAPEILGEIVKNNPQLCSDIAPIIVSFHEESMLTSAVLWAIGRIGKINTETVEYAIPIIKSYINSDNPVIRAYAALALGELGEPSSASLLKDITGEKILVDFYFNGELQKKSIGEIAEEAVAKLNSKQS